jgi:membrane-associated phospholipid phosphatase
MKSSLFLLIVALMANLGSSYILSFLHFDPLPVNDLLLGMIPQINSMGYLADLVLVLETLMFFWIWRKDKKKLAWGIMLVGVMLLVRSLLVLLTPVGNSFGMIEYSDFFSLKNLPSGMFPSGHTAFAFLGYLLLKDESNRKLAHVSLALLVIEVLALLISHGHYSIDIVGGLMLAYIIYRVGEDRRQKVEK